VNQAAAQLSLDASSNAKLVGIGGWLLLLIIKLWVGVTVRILGGIAEPNHLLALVNFGFAALAGIAAYLLGRKNPKGVMLARIPLAAEAVYYALELLPPASVDNPFKTAGFFTASVLYFIYLFRSKRVKNTYFPEPLEHTPASSVAVINGPENMSRKESHGVTTTTKSKGTAIFLFLIALLLWVATITHNTLGFVAPANAQAVGFDLWTAVMWLLFLYAGRKLYRTFWKKQGVV
jgi:hypothetical protein